MSDAAFWDFHRANPEVYITLVMLARQEMADGNRRIGMKLIYERARQQLKRSMPNVYTRSYGILLQQQNADLKGYITTPLPPTRAKAPTVEPAPTLDIYDLLGELA